MQSIKQKHHFTDRQALTFIVNDLQHAANWGVPQGHRGSKEQWIETLESRLQDAKRLQKLADQAERDLRAIAASEGIPKIGEWPFFGIFGVPRWARECRTLRTYVPTAFVDKESLSSAEKQM